MGWLEGIRRWLGPAPSESDLGGQIQWAVDRRLGLADYLSIPAVARARSLIVSLISELEPVAIRDGKPLDIQPRVLLRPAPEITRTEYLAQLAASLVDYGNAVLWQPVTGRNAAGYPEVSIVLPYSDVYVAWADESHLSRTYRWADRELQPGRDVIHIAIDRRAGELEGRSPLSAIEDSLARYLAAEIYAGDWFLTGAVPSVTLKYDGVLTDAASDAVKAKWIANHADHSPAVLPKGWDLKETGADPSSSQLLETRQHGAQEVARALGIFPAELLLAPVDGSSLTYQNVSEALMTFCRVTLQPQYLSPIEEAMADLLPLTQAVRFSTAELERLGTAARYDSYAVGLSAGFLSLERINAWEGWAAGEAPVPPSLAAVPPARMASEVLP